MVACIPAKFLCIFLTTPREMTATRHTLSKNEATSCLWLISSHPRPGDCRKGTRPCVLRVRRGACVNPQLAVSKHDPSHLPRSHCKHTEKRLCKGLAKLYSLCTVSKLHMNARDLWRLSPQ